VFWLQAALSITESMLSTVRACGRASPVLGGPSGGTRVGSPSLGLVPRGQARPSVEVSDTTGWGSEAQKQQPQISRSYALAGEMWQMGQGRLSGFR
jgi:hypothetical protein